MAKVLPRAMAKRRPALLVFPRLKTDSRIPSNHTLEYKTKTTVGEKKSTYLSTKTIYIPITSVSGSPKTTVKPYPVTSVGTSSKVSTALMLLRLKLTTATIDQDRRGHQVRHEDVSCHDCHLQDQGRKGAEDQDLG